MASSESGHAPDVPVDLKREVGRRIRDLRKARDLSQTALGRQLTNSRGREVAGSKVGSWERGEDLPSRRYWPQLARALETTIDAIFGGLTADMPDETLASRVANIEAEVNALIRLLDVEVGVEEAVRASRAAELRQRQRSSKPLADEVREAAGDPLPRARQPKRKRRSES